MKHTRDEIVYYIEDGKIIETTLGDLAFKYAEETTTPQGVGQKYHLRGLEGWTWGASGNFPEKICEFDTEEEANEWLFECALVDLTKAHNAPFTYRTRAEAEKELEEE